MSTVADKKYYCTKRKFYILLNLRNCCDIIGLSVAYMIILREVDVMNSHDLIVRPYNYDFKYEKSVIERCAPHVPSKVFDSHFHLSSGEIKDR